MKILITNFQINSWGGIVNYTENLVLGFKALGHKVNVIMLTRSGVSGIPTAIKDRSKDPEWEYAPGLKLYIHTEKGFNGIYRFNYHKDIDKWSDFTEEYDLVIHNVPVPTKSKNTEGDDLWPDIYDIFTNQIAIIHDGNMQRLYPHIITICDKIQGLVCVHDAAYNSCNVLPVPRALIGNPHNLKGKTKIKAPEERRDGFLSLQVFKRWKRVDQLIRSIPYMDEFTEKFIAGGGIEYHYMTSKDKVKKEYLEADGSRIWENAVNNGMEYLGYIPTDVRDNHLREIKLLIDPSWSKKYAQLGAHFNRVMIEAMIHGCVPLCTDLGMKNSLLFKAGVNYIELPHDSTPQQYAEIIENAMHDIPLLTKIQKANLQLIKQFNYIQIAKWVIDLSKRKPTGHIGKLETGAPDEKILGDSEKKMEHFNVFNL